LGNFYQKLGFLKFADDIFCMLLRNL